MHKGTFYGYFIRGPEHYLGSRRHAIYVFLMNYFYTVIFTGPDFLLQKSDIIEPTAISVQSIVSRSK